MKTEQDKLTVDYSHKVLEVKNLRKYFYLGSGKGKITIPAVDDISFDVYRREVFGLVGESGCGKTTAGRTIIKLYNPTDGTVDLNDFRISAGYSGQLHKIKKIKKKLNEDIQTLDCYKYEVLKIRREEEKEVGALNEQINNLLLEKEMKFKDAEKEIELHKDELFQLKNLYNLDIEKIKYNFFLNKKQILNKTKNPSLVEYKREVSILKESFSKKLDGLRDSNALSKAVRSERITVLKEEHKAGLKELSEKYQPLIAKDEEIKLDKASANEQIKVFQDKRDSNLSARHEQFLNEMAAVVAPNKEKIAELKAAINAETAEKISKINVEIAEVKNKYEQKVAEIPESLKESVDHAAIKTQAKELKLKAKIEIAEQRAQITEIKTVNRSKEALVASRKMQMIFQDPISSLNPRMTVREIVGEGLTILGGFSKEEIDKKVKESLELVGLSSEFAARYPHEFSGGQRQRIGIARALIMNPNFIIADEPISALDVSIRAQVINLLSQLKEELGLTILFIAHDLSVVKFFCDRIAVMYFGKIVEIATSAELFKNPMHPYTVSLLSAIPQPDPDYEKDRSRIHYSPLVHDYRVDKPSLKEIASGHFVYCNEQEFSNMKKKYNNDNKTEVKK